MINLDDTPFTVWIATNSPGEPICLSGKDGGYSITAWANTEGQIIGVGISTDEGYETIVGWIPGEELMDELEMQS